MDNLRVRKSFSNLGQGERKHFINAVLGLKKSGRYDELVKTHMDAMSNRTPWDKDNGSSRRNSAHRGPAFLPWHRKYLQVYEEALQNISGDPNLSLPYWDWLKDGLLSEPGAALIWTEQGVGGNGVLQEGWGVVDGPFAKWPLVHNGGSKPDILQRQLATYTQSLPTEKAREEMMSLTTYDQEPFDDFRELKTFRNFLEGWFPSSDGSRMHNQVHVWVGGSMLPGTSPNDPIFYLHHCFVDKLWADWQIEQLKKYKDIASSYQPHKDGPKGHNLDDPMFPWDKEDQSRTTIRDVLDHHQLGFRYDTEVVEELAPSAMAMRAESVEQTSQLKSDYV